MKLFLCFVAVCLLSIGWTSAEDFSTENIRELFYQELKHHHRSGEVTPLYQSLLDHFRFPKTIKSKDLAEPTPAVDIMCQLCTAALGHYMEEIRKGTTAAEIEEMVVELCVGLNIQNERVCRGIIAANVPDVFYIVSHRPALTVDQLCGVVFQDACPMEDLTPFEWTVTVDPNTPALTGSKDTSVPRSASDLTIAHITDPHYDPTYLVGSLAECDEPNCCRYDQPLLEDNTSDQAAGRWGDYRNCDSPLEAVQDAFTQIKRHHPDLDFVYFTGDIIDHAVWATSRTYNEAAINRINSLLANVFTGIPVFPVLGNHEPHPVNQFAPTGVPSQYSSQWLFDFVATEWSKWLPADALTTVRIGGYYTVLVRPGFRVVTINNNECYTYNWWISYEPTFPRIQLQWLHDVLLAAEANNEKVHILGHVPSGSGDCFTIWSREFRRIVDRFWNTISAQFGGHTHKDEFNIFYARDNPSLAVNVLWNGGSTTAYSDVNPNYKIYTMDQETYQINSHETWIYNLTLANLNPNQTPAWYKEYDFMTEYGIDRLSPAALSDLTNTFARTPTLLHRYWQLKYKMADTALANGCDDNCLGGHLCRIVTSEHGNSPRCEELMTIWNAARK